MPSSLTEFLRNFLLLPPEGSTFSVSADRLHFVVILTTFAGSFGVFLTAAIFIIRYRQRDPDQTTVHVPPSRLLEAAYIVLPLTLFVIWFFIGFRQYVYTETPPPGAMDVYVTAKQWMWKFTYPGGPNSINTLRLPVGRPVRLLLTSRDVIHSLFVPELRLKQDVLPGRYTQTWFTLRMPGRWRILCTEYCGLLHSEMRGELVALDPAEYEAWLANQRQDLNAQRDASASGPEQQAHPAPSLAEQGERIAVAQGCLACHSVDGSRHIGPTWLGLYMSRVPLEAGAFAIADEAYLTESIMEPDKKIVAHFQPLMPSYRGRIGAAEVAAIVEYIKSLRTDEVVPGSGQEPPHAPLTP